MERVSIDISLIDINLVDSGNREKTIKPYLTTVTDKATACIVGYHISLDPSERPLS